MDQANKPVKRITNQRIETVTERTAIHFLTSACPVAHMKRNVLYSRVTTTNFSLNWQK